MILEEIRLTNFRCFQKLRITLDRHLNVFVGGNGAGKTTILDGITLALAPVLARLPFDKRPRVPTLVPYDIRKMFGGTLDEDRTAPFLQIGARATANGRGPIAWDRIRFRDSSPATRQEAPAGGKEQKELQNYVDGIIDAHNSSRSYELPVFAVYGTDRAVNVPHNKLRKRAMPQQFKRLAGLEDALETRTDFRRAVAWFDWLEQRELRERRDGIISGALPDLDAIRRAVTSMIPGVRNPRIDGGTGRFIVDATDQSGAFIRLHLDQLSDGYQVMLGVVMDFALRLALANPPQAPRQDVLAGEAVLIIDEVDLHLHPSWQQRVVPDLRRTFPNTQLIVTTHSPQVATTIPSENLRILKESTLFSAPPGTEGAEAQRLLEEVFLVHPRPDVLTAHELDEYLRLVDAGKSESPRALELRQKLDQWSQGNEPRLLDADLQISNMKWEAGQ